MNFDYENLSNLIENCLQVNPEDSITAEDALKHPWFEKLEDN
jgi:serine/threonine protein kinase